MLRMTKKTKKNTYKAFDIETTGLNPWGGDSITCICSIDSDGKNFSKVNTRKTKNGELFIINSFINWLNQPRRIFYPLISKGGTRFDTPFILSRISQLSDFATLERARTVFTTGNVIDLETFSKARFSLDDLAKLLNIGHKLGTGIEAIQLFKDGNFTKLANYCMNDVELTAKIYIKLYPKGV